MIHVQVTDEQRRELEQVSRQAVGRVALRAYMVLLSARGHSVPQIAAIHDCGCDVVRHWLHHYGHEVNPIERIWGLMKDDVAANRLAGSIEELTAKARRFFADLGAHPVSLPLAA